MRTLGCPGAHVPWLLHTRAESCPIGFRHGSTPDPWAGEQRLGGNLFGVRPQEEEEDEAGNFWVVPLGSRKKPKIFPVALGRCRCIRLVASDVQPHPFCCFLDSQSFLCSLGRWTESLIPSLTLPIISRAAARRHLLGSTAVQPAFTALEASAWGLRTYRGRFLLLSPKGLWQEAWCLKKGMFLSL